MQCELYIKDKEKKGVKLCFCRSEATKSGRDSKYKDLNLFIFISFN